MNIPQEAIDAAAQAAYKNTGLPDPWDSLPENTRNGYREAARLHLVAAFPVLAAHALREYAITVEKNRSFRYWDRRDVARDVRTVATEYQEGK